jgi:ornithine carbamoyltransferase
LRLAYVGDGNNVLHSLLLMAPFMGVDLHYCCPSGYQPEAEILFRAQSRARDGGAKIRSFDLPEEAVSGCHAVYTDVWTSMGFEAEDQKRREAFEGFQVNAKLMSLADPTAVVMHCLPMVRGLEIAEDVIDTPRCVIFQQAANRLHAQKALLTGLFRRVPIAALGIESTAARIGVERAR